MYISGQFQEIGVLIDQDPPVSPLKKMSYPAILTVEVSRVATVDPVHDLQQVSLGGLKREMIVIAHEYKTVNDQVKAVAVILQDAKESFPVRILDKDVLLLIPSAGYVVQRTRILYP